MKTIGYAIVGTGYFGAELGRIMKEQEGAKIVAVLDPENAQTVAEELGCDVETVVAVALLAILALNWGLQGRNARKQMVQNAALKAYS